MDLGKVKKWINYVVMEIICLSSIVYRSFYEIFWVEIFCPLLNVITLKQRCNKHLQCPGWVRRRALCNALELGEGTMLSVPALCTSVAAASVVATAVAAWSEV